MSVPLSLLMGRDSGLGCYRVRLSCKDGPRTDYAKFNLAGIQDEGSLSLLAAADV
jgi:hypothetical protein